MSRDAVALLFVHELAARYCERSTTIRGCIGDPDYDRPGRICDPCAARKALGIEHAIRRCERCNAPVDEEGIDSAGGDSCPAPKHRPHRFYHERGDAA